MNNRTMLPTLRKCSCRLKESNENRAFGKCRSAAKDSTVGFTCNVCTSVCYNGRLVGNW